MNVLLRTIIVLFCGGGALHAQTTAALVHEGIVDAPVQQVWSAWTTTEGLSAWLAPHVEIDLEIGGAMRTNYDPAGALGDPQTIENTIIAFEPLRMLAIKVSSAPADFPFPNAIDRMWTVVYFDDIGAGKTMIRMVAQGFGADQESQDMRAFFDRGNLATMRQLQEHFPGSQQTLLDANKQLLLDFFAFQGSREERAERFLDEDYIQHNPRLLRMDEITGASGGDAWLYGFQEAERRGIRIVDLGGIPLRDPVIIMAEGDLVTAIYKGDLADPDDPNRSYEAFAFETVRIRDGKFVEHWDQVTLAPGWMESTAEP